MQWLDSITRHWDVWRTAWDEQRHQRPAAAPRRREAEFLPAVLEIQDSPPSPVGRAIAGTVITVFLAGIVWACLGKIDIVAVAPGKIIPSG
jgi:hemolysin D